MKTLAVLIPAYRPTDELVRLVERLAPQVAVVVVVDDGSGAGYAAVFAGLEGRCTVLRHDRNLGKGQALKTGLGYIGRQWPHCRGVVTADADGQHRVEDILAVGQAFLHRPEALMLGVRQLKAGTPWRSRLGNSLARGLINRLLGTAWRDTQTGLRALPAACVAACAQLAGQRYEYETHMLVWACRRAMPIVEVPIQTVYIDGNAASHFRPLIDAWRIVYLLVRVWGTRGEYTDSVDDK